MNRRGVSVPALVGRMVLAWAIVGFVVATPFLALRSCSQAQEARP